jgi:hypothetical protein
MDTIDAIELKQQHREKRNEKVWKAIQVTFLNPGFVLLIVGLGVFAVITSDTRALALAGRITMETNMIVTTIAMVGLYIVAGVWVLYTRIQGLYLEIRK